MRIALAVFVLMLISCASIAAQDARHDRDAKIEQELRKLVQSWDEAFVKADTATLDRLLAKEFSFVGGLKKVDYLASFKSRPNDAVASAVSTDIEVQVYGDTAILTGLDTITGKNKGESYTSKWLYLDVWVRRDDRWQCVKTYSAPARR